MSRFLVTALCALALLSVAWPANASDKNKNQETDKQAAAKKVEELKKKADDLKKDADAGKKAAEAKAAELKKQQEEREKQQAAAAKKLAEERAKQRAEAKKKFEEQQKEREAASALARRRAQAPRIVQDLLDERQIGQVEGLKKSYDAAITAKSAEMRKLNERFRELQAEMQQARERYDESIERLLNDDQKKILAKRKAEIEAKQVAFQKKRDAERAEALKKREAEQKKK